MQKFCSQSDIMQQPLWSIRAEIYLLFLLLFLLFFVVVIFGGDDDVVVVTFQKPTLKVWSKSCQ